MEELRWFGPAELEAAVMDSTVLLSSPVSIAFQLIADWFRQQGGGDLDRIVRRARGRE